MAVVVLDIQEYRERFPQFADAASYPDAMMQGAFETACVLFDNSERSPAPYDPDKGVSIRKTILYALTCHLLTLAGWSKNGQSGPVSNASEGSVSVGFAVPQVTDKSYFLLTPCGQSYWQITAPYRVGGRYYAPKQYHPWG